MNTPTPPVRPEMEALACPFCNEPPIVYSRGGAWGSKCAHEHHYAQAYGKTRDEAVSNWNRRASAPEQAVKGLEDTNAIETALAKLRWYGIDIASPRDGDLDDVEQERYNGFVDACRAYIASLSLKENIPEPVSPTMDFAETLNFYISDCSNGYSHVPRQKLVEIQAELRALTAALSHPASHEGWRTMESAPKDRLIDIWLAGGVRWCDCYYDRICGEWRTTRPSGKLVSVKEAFATHWREPPAAPPPAGSGGTGA